jgi:hypothetical protein
MYGYSFLQISILGMILKSNQKYLKFPLTLPLSPMGRGEG